MVARSTCGTQLAVLYISPGLLHHHPKHSMTLLHHIAVLVFTNTPCSKVRKLRNRPSIPSSSQSWYTSRLLEQSIRPKIASLNRNSIVMTANDIWPTHSVSVLAFRYSPERTLIRNVGQTLQAPRGACRRTEPQRPWKLADTGRDSFAFCS